MLWMIGAFCFWVGAALVLLAGGCWLADREDSTNQKDKTW
jgi:hypothetical protein